MNKYVIIWNTEMQLYQKYHYNDIIPMDTMILYQWIQWYYATGYNDIIPMRTMKKPEYNDVPGLFNGDNSVVTSSIIVITVEQC